MTDTNSQHSDQINTLMATVALLAGVIEDQFSCAIDAIFERNPAKVFQVNQHRRTMHQFCSEIVRQASVLMSSSLSEENQRTVFAGMRLAVDFERMSDIAGSIADRAASIHFDTSPSFISTLKYMNDEILSQINDSVLAYVNAHLDTVYEIYRKYVKVDQIAQGFFREMLTYLIEDPKIITPVMHLLSVIKSLEKAAELMTHIAETLYYQVTGTNFVELKDKMSKKEKDRF
jgi:phosphate transport system protein